MKPPSVLYAALFVSPFAVSWKLGIPPAKPNLGSLGRNKEHYYARCRRSIEVVEGRSYIDDVIEFESRVNDVWRRHDDAVICTYHLSKFGGDTVIDIMRTHPMIIIGGILQRNPFFVPPDEFLREIRGRRAMQTGSSTAA